MKVIVSYIFEHKMKHRTYHVTEDGQGRDDEALNSDLEDFLSCDEINNITITKIDMETQA